VVESEIQLKGARVEAALSLQRQISENFLLTSALAGVFAGKAVSRPLVVSRNAAVPIPRSENARDLNVLGASRLRRRVLQNRFFAPPQRNVANLIFVAIIH
jgi:hypothetical protein